MRLSEYGPDNKINFPISGGGSAIVKGVLLRKDATTPGTMSGHLRPLTGNAGRMAIALLQEAHATANDTDVAGTIFTTHPCDIIIPTRILRIEYSLAAADDIDATQAVSTTTITLTDLENDIDTAFLYVVTGTGRGQTNYLTASAAGSATLKAAFTTNLDTTSRLIKILPRFHELVRLTADGTKLASAAGVGAIDAVVLDSWIVRNNNEQQLNPTQHDALTGLHGLASLRFEADIALLDTLIYQLT